MYAPSLSISLPSSFPSSLRGPPSLPLALSPSSSLSLSLSRRALAKRRTSVPEASVRAHHAVVEVLVMKRSSTSGSFSVADTLVHADNRCHAACAAAKHLENYTPLLSPAASFRGIHGIPEESAVECSTDAVGKSDEVFTAGSFLQRCCLAVWGSRRQGGRREGGRRD